MNRPKDIYGQPIEMGPWYWARSRTGIIVGAGRFASTIGSDECTWFCNGTGYSPDRFTFLAVAVDPVAEFEFVLNAEKEARREAALSQSYADIAASGGIVDAP